MPPGRAAPGLRSEDAWGGTRGGGPEGTRRGQEGARGRPRGAPRRGGGGARAGAARLPGPDCGGREGTGRRGWQGSGACEGLRGAGTGPPRGAPPPFSSSAAAAPQACGGAPVTRVERRRVPLTGSWEGWDGPTPNASGRGSGCRSPHRAYAPDGGEPRAGGVSPAGTALARPAGSGSAAAGPGRPLCRCSCCGGARGHPAPHHQMRWICDGDLEATELRNSCASCVILYAGELFVARCGIAAIGMSVPGFRELQENRRLNLGRLLSIELTPEA